MNLALNPSPPTIMHIDINSCFATCEQQAYPNLRGKPLVVAAYTTPRGFILAPSIEAKRYGIKMDMTVRDARRVYPRIIVRDPDPPMIRYIHVRLRDILKRYSPLVIPKSIDEFVIDLSETSSFKKNMVEVGDEIKSTIKKEIGEWIWCSIGISTNRFLAKLAASLQKPDGLTVISDKNIHHVYASLKLIDLPGINVRYEARLKAASIFTPLDFLEAPCAVLEHTVFKSIVGRYWYKRLRGWEADDMEFGRKSFGQEYSLGKQTAESKEIARLIMKLCNKMVARLRQSNFFAKGVGIGLGYTDGTYWHIGKSFSTNFSTLSDFYIKAMYLFGKQPFQKVVRNISVHCFDLVSGRVEQLSLFPEETEKKEAVQRAMDKVNTRWGEFKLTPASMMGMRDVILDRIAFGNARY